MPKLNTLFTVGVTVTSARAFVAALLAAVLLATPAAAQQLLYDNGPLVTHPGEGFDDADASAVQTALSMNTYGGTIGGTVLFRISDEVEISDENGWIVDTLTMYAYLTSPGPETAITEASLRIWDGPPGVEGSNVVFGDNTTNRILSVEPTNIYRVLDTGLLGNSRHVQEIVLDAEGIHLPSGQYWVDFGATAPQPVFAPPISILGETTTGDAVQYNPTSDAWNPWVDSGTSAAQGLPFLAHGNMAYVNLTNAGSVIASGPHGLNATAIPALGFYMSTNISETVTLTSVNVALLNAVATAPYTGGMIPTISLFADANGDGLADDPANPLTTAPVAADGTALLELTAGTFVEPDEPSAFVAAVNVASTAPTTVAPFAAIGLALLLPGLLRLRVRRTRLVASVLVIALLAAACSSTPRQPDPDPDPTVVQLRLSITGANAEVGGGDFSGSVLEVDLLGTPIVGPVIRLEY